MRTVFADKNDFIIEDDDEDVAIAFIRRTIREVYPWAAEIIEVDGGWMVFESAADAETWNNQQ